jgi:hypothetical protein
MELVHAIIKIASNKSNTESLKKAVEGIIISENLYSHRNIHDQIEKMSKSIEFKILINFIEAIDGDMEALGQICDHIFYDNKSWISTLFSILNTGKFSLDNICSEKHRELAKKKFQKDIKRLFECLFSMTCDDRKLNDFILQYNVPSLLFSLMCPNMTIIEKFFKFRDSIQFLENDLITTILNLSSLQELVPTLYCAFRTAKPFLEQKHQIQIAQTDENSFPLKIENFKYNPNPVMHKMGILYDSLNFKKQNTEDILSLEKQQLYSSDFGYQIEQNGVQVNAAKLFKLIFQTAYGDKNAMLVLMDILAPLFRDITGGLAVVKIASILAKGQKQKIFTQMANLVRLIIIEMITNKIEMKSKIVEETDDFKLSDDEIKKFSETFDFTASLVTGVVCWIKGSLMLLDKNTANISIDTYREAFYSMCDSLSVYEDEIQREDKLVHDISKQTDLMIAILGFCRGNYRKIEVIGVQVG